MSSLIVELSRINDITEHPNADKLELTMIKGWQCVVRKDAYQKNDLVIYVPIDAVLPSELSDKLNITQYLSKGRVRTTRLRGEYSQGLIIDLDEVADNGHLAEGDDIKDMLGITKFEPPVKMSVNDSKLPDHPQFIRYTDIENLKNFPDVLKKAEEVVITEKLHGSNFRVMKTDSGELLVGSHRINLAENSDLIYWKIAGEFDLDNILNPGEILFGEIYGPKIQKLNYDLKKVTAAFFDIMIDMNYLNNQDFIDYCLRHRLPMVPYLFKGPWQTDLTKLASGDSELAGHIKEGIVIKPIEERFDQRIGRVILKHISERYLLKDYGDDH